MATLTAVVKELGHTPKNIRQEWSWQSDNQVTLALWSHLLVNNEREYHNANKGAGGGPGSPADKRRRKHIAYAIDHLKGKVSSAIVTQNSDTTTEAIESVRRGPQWRVTTFNPSTGSFHLEQITFANLRQER